MRDLKAKAEYDKKYYARNRKKRLEQETVYRQRNRKQINKKIRKWYQNGGKEIKRAHRWRTLYGLSPEQVKFLYRFQRHRCAICGIHERHSGGRWSKLNIDHKNKIVRGLLCVLCNRILGLLEKRPKLLKLCGPFREYLISPPAKQIPASQS